MNFSPSSVSPVPARRLCRLGLDRRRAPFRVFFARVALRLRLARFAKDPLRPQSRYRNVSLHIGEPTNRESDLACHYARPVDWRTLLPDPELSVLHSRKGVLCAEIDRLGPAPDTPRRELRAAPHLAERGLVDPLNSS